MATSSRRNTFPEISRTLVMKCLTVFSLVSIFMINIGGAAAKPVRLASSVAILQQKTKGIPKPSDPAALESRNAFAQVMFIQNVGQFDPKVRFVAIGANATIFLTEDSIWLTILESRVPDQAGPESDSSDPSEENLGHLPQKRVNLKIFFPGSNSHTQLEPFDQIDIQVSTLLGNDSAKWRSGAPVWSGVRYVDIYPGADLVITGQDGDLAWDFTIRDADRFFAQNGHVKQQGLRVKIAGQKGLMLVDDLLSVSTELGDYDLPSFHVNGASNSKSFHKMPRLDQDELWLIEPELPADPQPELSFQPAGLHGAGVLASAVESHRTELTTNQSQDYSVFLKDGHDRLLFAILLGGSNREVGKGIAVDGNGNIYITGHTSSPDFPTQAGYDAFYSGNEDVFVLKMDPNSGQLIYATFLGGNSQDDATSISVDILGAAYVTGWTVSGNFPTDHAFDPSFNSSVGCSPVQPPKPCADAFVTKLNPTGNDLEYSSFIGGNGNEFARSSEIGVDGTVYLVGSTTSSNLYGTSTSGHFALKIAPDGTAPAYVKSLSAKFVNDMDVGTDGYTYFTGQTSADDVYVSSLDDNGNTIYSKSFGGSGLDRGLGIAVDSSGTVALTGGAALKKGTQTSFPTTEEALKSQITVQDAFVTRLDPAGEIVYSTLLGGDVADIGTSLSIDAQGNLYLVGGTGGLNFLDAPDMIKADPESNDDDVFALVLSPFSATRYELGYGTYVGGSDNEYSDLSGSAIDESGNVYVTGYTSSPDFQGIPGASSSHIKAFAVMIHMVDVQPDIREPVILLPGVTGTYLNNRNGELWPNAAELITSSEDDFLLPLRLDATGTGPLYPNDLDYSTVEAGEIISEIAGQDVYAHAIERLEQAGYQQGVDLFVFSYDWRQDIDFLANELLSRIDEIRAQTGAERVNIVAHSMGGLITRAVLTNHNSIGKVHKVFTLGTPVLGAPKILGILEYQTPCFMDVAWWCEPNEITAQDLLTNMIPTYQMLPGPMYDLAQIAPLNIDRDINGDGDPEGLQDYQDWTAIVSAHRNSLLMQKNESFHQAYDNLSLADPSVEFYRIVGDELNTIAQMREYIKCTFGNFNCRVAYGLIFDNGDQTVPLHSADLYNPDTGFDYRTERKNYYAHGVAHAGLPGDECVLNMIIAFVENSPAGCVNATTSIFKLAALLDNTTTTISNIPEPFSGIELETLGPVQGIVQDQEGNLLGLSTDLDPNVIPGGVYNAISDTQSFFLNQNGNYVAQLTVTGTEPVILRMRSYAEDAMNGQAVFNVNAPADGRLQIAFNNGNDLAGLRLQIDTNADGLFDEMIPPDSYYTGSAASETIPPTTTISLDWASPQVAEVTLTANDQPDGTGVADTYYRILGDSNPELTVYTNPFRMALGAELQFFSVDRVGNTEVIQTIQTVSLDIHPGDFPNNINTQSAGKTPAAILGTSVFNVASVDVTTIMLAGAPVIVRPNGIRMASFEDVNRDGFLDLVFHVSTSALQLDISSIEAYLFARTQDGTQLIGVDAVRIVH
jgi:pimeloyl-ACP methyl ester carboxylesterase